MLAVGAFAQDPGAGAPTEGAVLEEIVVVADGSVRSRQGDLGSVTTVDAEAST